MNWKKVLNEAFDEAEKLEEERRRAKRDPVRIRRILNKLETLWLAYPDLRLGQLYLITADIFETDKPRETFRVFSFEDAEFELYLDRELKAKGLDNGWKS